MYVLVLCAAKLSRRKRVARPLFLTPGRGRRSVCLGEERDHPTGRRRRHSPRATRARRTFLVESCDALSRERLSRERESCQGGDGCPAAVEIGGGEILEAGRRRGRGVRSTYEVRVTWRRKKTRRNQPRGWRGGSSRLRAAGTMYLDVHSACQQAKAHANS